MIEGGKDSLQSADMLNTVRTVTVFTSVLSTMTLYPVHNFSALSMQYIVATARLECSFQAPVQQPNNNNSTKRTRFLPPGPNSLCMQMSVNWGGVEK